MIFIGLIGYALLVIAAGMVDIRLGVAVAGGVCLYLAYVNPAKPVKK